MIRSLPFAAAVALLATPCFAQSPSDEMLAWQRCTLESGQKLAQSGSDSADKVVEAAYASCNPQEMKYFLSLKEDAAEGSGLQFADISKELRQMFGGDVLAAVLSARSSPTRL